MRPLLFPHAHKQLFAWPIAPSITAMFIGASYVNGVIFFASVLAGKKWHRIWAPHVILGKMKSAFVGANLPLWFQKSVAAVVTPTLYLFGYRAVNKRFSGEEW